MGSRKFLVLSDIPPCSNYTGGVVLADQLRNLEPGLACAFVVLNRGLRPEYFDDLNWLKIKTVEKPNEGWVEEPDREKAIATETYNATIARDALIAEAVAFGREEGVNAVFAILEGQTVVRMAARLAAALGVPLYTQVWDPLSWWLKAHEVDEANCQNAHEAFDEAILKSRGVATASIPMAELYTRKYGARCLPVINSQDRKVARPPSPGLRDPGVVTIGMVGQFYASDAWKSFISGLNDEGWKIGRREVNIYYLGQEPPQDVPPERMVHDGWLPQAEAIDALNKNVDICYCPYPFGAEMEEVAQLSFPSKLVAYMASGKPIFAHAPWYSSLARYVAGSLIGVVSGDLDPGAAFRMLKWLVDDQQLYADAAQASHAAFLRDFTKETMRSNFEQVLELASHR